MGQVSPSPVPTLPAGRPPSPGWCWTWRSPSGRTSTPAWWSSGSGGRSSCCRPSRWAPSWTRPAFPASRRGVSGEGSRGPFHSDPTQNAVPKTKAKPKLLPLSPGPCAMLTTRAHGGMVLLSTDGPWYRPLQPARHPSPPPPHYRGALGGANTSVKRVDGAKRERIGAVDATMVHLAQRPAECLPSQWLREGGGCMFRGNRGNPPSGKLCLMSVCSPRSFFPPPPREIVGVATTIYQVCYRVPGEILEIYWLMFTLLGIPIRSPVACGARQTPNPLI